MGLSREGGRFAKRLRRPNSLTLVVVVLSSSPPFLHNGGFVVRRGVVALVPMPSSKLGIKQLLRRRPRGTSLEYPPPHQTEGEIPTHCQLCGNEGRICGIHATSQSALCIQFNATYIDRCGNNRACLHSRPLSLSALLVMPVLYFATMPCRFLIRIDNQTPQ